MLPFGPKLHRYGGHPEQYGLLQRPVPGGTGGVAVVVILHGGFWRARYGLDLGRPLSTDLTARGYWCWNLEYRRVGNGGGWPATFSDVAAGIDHLAELAQQHPDLCNSRVIVVGHSAGGQLATWAGCRSALPDDAPGARPAVTLTGVVSQAGVLNLGSAAAAGIGGSAVSDLLGGTPATVPGRYAHADPTSLLPASVPVRCLHSRQDETVPYRQSSDYVTAARAAGGHAMLVPVPGTHLDMIDPTQPAWQAALEQISELLAGGTER